MPDLEHDLRRNSANEPVCVCGYRPEILDAPAPVGKQWKAKTAVLDHAKALNEYEAIVDDVAFKWPPANPIPARLRRSPDDPFVVPEARYPRAGVRQTPSGAWLLTCWDGDQNVHVVDQPVFTDRESACEVGRIIIGAHRQSGTDLNGLGR